MRTLFYPALATIILLTSATLSVTAIDYKIKEGHTIQFKSKDPTGVFKEMKGTIKFDDADLAGSKFDLTFAVSSISTGNGMMNKKALTAEWFNATKYPDIKFTSSSVTKSGDDYVVTGKLTMKGISKEKKIPLKAVKSGTDMTFSGSFIVNRTEFKVGHASDAVPNNMTINYSIPVAKK